MGTNRSPGDEAETGKSSTDRWNAALYDSKHSFIWRYGADLIDLLMPRQGERILDLGCGTGHLSAKIAEAGAQVLGIDRSPRMIERARHNYPAIRFEVRLAEDFKVAQPYDAVFSNAVLHWVQEPDRAVESIARALKPSGRLIAEFGGRGNIQTVLDAFEKILHEVGIRLNGRFWYFPMVGEYATVLERHGFHVEFAMAFDRPTPLEDGDKGLRSWLEMFTDHVLATVPHMERNELFDRIEKALRPKLYRDGTWHIDYKRIRIRAVKA